MIIKRQAVKMAQCLPMESEQAFAAINKFSYFHGLNWIISTPDIKSIYVKAVRIFIWILHEEMDLII